MSEENGAKKVQLSATGRIVLPKIDLTQYIGKDTRIAAVEELEGDYGYFVRVTSEPVGMIGENPLCASVVLGLQEDNNGNIGWGEDTKMDLFLKSKGVNHYNELPGVAVKVQIKTNKQGQQFLTMV